MDGGDTSHPPSPTEGFGTGIRRLQLGWWRRRHGNPMATAWLVGASARESVGYGLVGGDVGTGIRRLRVGRWGRRHGNPTATGWSVETSARESDGYGLVGGDGGTEIRRLRDFRRQELQHRPIRVHRGADPSVGDERLD